MPYELHPDLLTPTDAGREGLPYRRCSACNYNDGYAAHPQRHVTVEATSMCLDVGIADLVEQMWLADIETTSSCQGDAHWDQHNPAEPLVLSPPTSGSDPEATRRRFSLLPHAIFPSSAQYAALICAILTEHEATFPAGAPRRSDAFTDRVRGGRPMAPKRAGDWLTEVAMFGRAAPDLRPGVALYPGPEDVNYATELLRRHNQASGR